MSEELRPCPHCRGEAQMGETHDRGGGLTYEVYCSVCAAGVGRWSSWTDSASQREEAKGKAIAAWNTRAPDTAQAELLREAGEVITDFVTGGCYMCGGDCASANPPVASCPMALARSTLAKIKGGV